MLRLDKTDIKRVLDGIALNNGKNEFYDYFSVFVDKEFEDDSDVCDRDEIFDLICEFYERTAAK